MSTEVLSIVGVLNIEHTLYRVVLLKFLEILGGF